MSKKGSLILFPNYLSEDNTSDFLPQITLENIKNTKYFVVEKVRNARRFISSLKLDIEIESLHFVELEKKTLENDLNDIFQPVFKGNNLGLLSEAGLPAIADPGNFLVSYAHQNQIEVITMLGSSSILLGLISSGFNGQQFTFHGYLPIEKNELINSLKKMEKEVSKSNTTQIFIETPYRNDRVLSIILETLHSETLLYIGKNLSGNEFISKSLKIKDWKKLNVNINNSPVIFALGKF